MRKSIRLVVLLMISVLCGCGGGGGGNGGGGGGGGATPGNFAENNAAVTESGYFDSLNSVGDARTKRRFAAEGDQLDFVVKGTDCTLNYLTVSDQTLQVSIDGAAYKTMGVNTTNTWSTLSLFTGLADKAHTVSLKVAPGKSTDVAVDLNNMVTVKGAAPALANISTVDPVNWGNQYPVLPQGNASPYILAEAGTLTPKTNLNNYPTGLLISQTYADGSLIFRANCSEVRAWMFLDGAKWQATVDGVNQPVVTLPITLTYGWVTLASNLNPNTTHTIVLTCVNFNDYTAIYSVMLPGGKITASAPPTRPVFQVEGHSIVAGKDLDDLTEVYYQNMAQSHGYAIASRGIDGSTFLTVAGSQPQYTTESVSARVTEVTAIKPAILVVDGFTNDMANASGVQPPETPAALQAGLQTYLATILAQSPNTHIYVLGILDRVGFESKIPTWDTAIQAAVTAQNSARCQYVSQTGWIDPTTDTFDGLHPNQQGSQKIAAHLSAIIFP